MLQASFDFEGAASAPAPARPATPKRRRKPVADAFLEAFIAEHRARGKRVDWSGIWGRLRPAVRSALTRRVDGGLPRDWKHDDPWAGLAPHRRLAEYVRLCADGCPIADPERVDQMAAHLARDCADRLPRHWSEADPKSWYNSHTMTKMVLEQVPHASYRQCLLAVARHCPTLFHSGD